MDVVTHESRVCLTEVVPKVFSVERLGWAYMKQGTVLTVNGP